MYSSRPNLMIGFHGCDESVRNSLVLNPNIVQKSQENYDWLGHGFYVWENNYERALKWAQDKQTRQKINKASVVGVIYQLDYCLDFTDSQYTDLLPVYFELMKRDFLQGGIELPENRDVPKDHFFDKVVRELDCAVIEYLHQKIEEEINLKRESNLLSELRQFDTVRGVFTEGGPAFDGAGIQLKNHIQICIRNLNCIKGFFIPRKNVKFP